MNFDEDLVLIARSRNGDLSAFDVLFTKYRPRLLKNIRGILSSKADAEDAVQEAFLSAFRAISSFREESCFFSWLYRIALNYAFSSMEKDKRQIPACSLSLKSEEEWDRMSIASANWTSPAEMFQTKQMILTIDKELNSMAISFAETFVFREVNGLTYDQISEKMQCSIGTVRSRLFRARQIINVGLGKM